MTTEHSMILGSLTRCFYCWKVQQSETLIGCAVNNFHLSENERRVSGLMDSAFGFRVLPSECNSCPDSCKSNAESSWHGWVSWRQTMYPDANHRRRKAFRLGHVVRALDPRVEPFRTSIALLMRPQKTTTIWSHWYFESDRSDGFNRCTLHARQDELRYSDWSESVNENDRLCPHSPLKMWVRLIPCLNSDVTHAWSVSHFTAV